MVGTNRRLHECFELAVASQSWDVLHWLQEQNESLLSPKVCAVAVSTGNLELLQWLRQVGCERDAEACAMAAEHGLLRLLQWARGQQCIWNSSICQAAARYGLFEILQWAHEHSVG